MGRDTILAAFRRSARRRPTPIHIRVAKGVAVRVLFVILRGTLARYEPRVVVVTGSVGKSTTTELVAAVLRTRYEVRATVDNHNSELGVATIALGIDWPSSSGRMLGDLAGAVGLLLRRGRYPEVLVLELGAIREGGLRRMTDALRPDIAVVTAVGSAHLGTFLTTENTAAEKSRVVRCLRPDGVAVLNGDDIRVAPMAKLARGRVVTYGLHADADVAGAGVDLTTGGSTGVVRLRGDGELPFRSPLLGLHQVGAVLAAVAVGRELGVSPEAALAAVAEAVPLPGRLRALPGPSGLVVLDDSYNASPEAVLAALEVLAHFPSPRLAVLGEMRHLGDAARDGYERVGAALGLWLDELIVVGATAGPIGESARAGGLPSSRITHVADAEAAARIVSESDGRTGTALVKGEMPLLLERVVAALLRDPSIERDFRRHPSLYRRH